MQGDLWVKHVLRLHCYTPVFVITLIITYTYLYLLFIPRNRTNQRKTEVQVLRHTPYLDFFLKKKTYVRRKQLWVIQIFPLKCKWNFTILSILTHLLLVICILFFCSHPSFCSASIPTECWAQAEPKLWDALTFVFLPKTTEGQKDINWHSIYQMTLAFLIM